LQLVVRRHWLVELGCDLPDRMANLPDGRFELIAGDAELVRPVSYFPRLDETDPGPVLRTSLAEIV
jgi:hypothetical protein